MPINRYSAQAAEAYGNMVRGAPGYWDLPGSGILPGGDLMASPSQSGQPRSFSGIDIPLPGSGGPLPPEYQNSIPMGPDDQPIGVHGPIPMATHPSPYSPIPGEHWIGGGITGLDPRTGAPIYNPLGALPMGPMDPALAGQWQNIAGIPDGAGGSIGPSNAFGGGGRRVWLN